MKRRVGALALAVASLSAGCSAASDPVAVATTTAPDDSSSSADATDSDATDSDATDSDATDSDETTSSVDTSTAPPASGPDTTATPLSGELEITIVATHPHDPNAFTQGLEILDGQLVESTGLYGESDRRLVDIATGEVTAIEALDDQLFGEGLTVVDDEILQLTWRAGVMIRSDATTLAEIDRTTYEGQGWGLCHDGEQLVMSNGSSTLAFRDPDTFAVERQIVVTSDNSPVELLNELECVNGQVLANVWLSDLIVVIDPESGVVEATLDGSSLRPDGAPRDDSDFALNGIAHDPTTGHFYLTGKLWPVLYEVELS